MKKIISLTLSLLMLFSCFSVLTAGALDAGDIADTLYTEESVAASATALMNLEIKKLPENYDCDIRSLPAWNEVSLLGMDLDYLYNGKGSFTWGFLDVFTTDAAGNKVMKITLDDVKDAFSNLNTYLIRVVYNYCGGIDFYTVENAIAISNFIGELLYPDFVKRDADNFKDLFNNTVPTTNDFYRTIASISGLSEIIEYNWLPKGKNFYKPLIDVLGGTYVDFYEDYYADGVKLGAKVIEGVISKLTTAGPIEFIVDILKSLSSSSYALVYRDPTLALFKLKKDLYHSVIPSDVMNSLDGLLKLIFCDCDPVKKTGCYSSANNPTHFCPVEFPVSRFASAADNTEATLYLYYYLNLCGAYKDNAVVINGWKDAINASPSLSKTDKDRIGYIFDGFFLGGVDKMINNVVVPLYKENISTSTDTIFQRFKNTMMNFLKKIADYFDYLRKIFTGELEYGQGNSPFN